MSRLALIGGVCLLGWVLLSSRSATALPDGSKPVPTETSYDWVRQEPEVDGVVELLDRSGAELGRYFLRNGQLYEPADGKNLGSLRLTRHLYAVDPGFDLGVWGGYWAGERDASQSAYQVGLRYSPLRLGYGLVSPDAIVSRDLFGIGASIYPPERYFGREWHHLGLGVWFAAPLVGGDPNWVAGLSFSTRE